MQDTNRNRYLSINITVQAIIVAALLIWVQYWNHSYDVYKLYNVCGAPEAQPIWHISLSIAAIFTAATASLVSILFTLLHFVKNKDYFIRWILALSGFSISILLLIAISAAGTIWFRALVGADKWCPFDCIQPECATLVTILATAFGIGLLLVWILCWGKCLAKKLNTK